MIQAARCQTMEREAFPSLVSPSRLGYRGTNVRCPRAKRSDPTRAAPYVSLTLNAARLLCRCPSVRHSHDMRAKLYTFADVFTFMAYSSGALPSQDKRNHGQASCAEVPFANLDFSAAGKSCAPVRSISCSPSKPARSDDERVPCFPQ
jgi:hypothetical protein